MNQNYPTREDAINLLHEYTKTDSLRRHALGVEQAMRKMAEKYHGDPDEWGILDSCMILIMKCIQQ